MNTRLALKHFLTEFCWRDDMSAYLHESHAYDLEEYVATPNGEKPFEVQTLDDPKYTVYVYQGIISAPGEEVAYDAHNVVFKLVLPQALHQELHELGAYRGYAVGVKDFHARITTLSDKITTLAHVIQ